MGTVLWGADIAEAYDASAADMFSADVLGPTVDLLAQLAGDGAALELAIGTGRVGLALSAGGTQVRGIELSPSMVEQLRRKPGAEAVEVTIGDMATTTVEGDFTLVYLVYNSITNLTTQEEQVAVFRNAAAHLVPGGCFVIELVVPQLRGLPPGELARVFTLEKDHIGVETFDDPLGQISWCHHWMDVGGKVIVHAAPYRYVWPSELDLMAQLAGLRVRDRWADWERAPFVADSPSQVVVFEKPA